MDRGLQISEVRHFLKNKKSLLYSEVSHACFYVLWGFVFVCEVWFFCCLLVVFFLTNKTKT